MVVRQKKHEDKIRQAVDIGNLLKYTDLQNKKKVSSYLSLFCFNYKLIVFGIRRNYPWQMALHRRAVIKIKAILLL